MAKISALIPLALARGNDVLPVVQDARTGSLTLAQLAAQVALLMPEALRGTPGGTDYSIGLFSAASTLTIPAGIDLVSVTGMDVLADAFAGTSFVADPVVDEAYVAARPRGDAFVDATGRGFRLAGYRFRVAVARMRTIAAELDDLGLRSSQVLPQAPDGVTDNTADLQALIDAGDCTILAMPQPYYLSAPLRFSKGRTVRVQPGTRILYNGPVMDTNHVARAIGVFELADDTQLLCDGPEGSVFTVECPQDQSYVYGARGLSVTNARVVGLMGQRCHVAFFSAARAIYADVVTPAMVAAGSTKPVTTCRRVAVIGGGCSFDTKQHSHGSVYLGYTFDAEVRRVRGIRGHTLVQWWGGDSGTEGWQNGHVGNERKAGNFLIEDTYSEDMAAASIFGSMGRDIVVRGGRSYRVGDVAFDPEGSNNVVFENCYSEDAANGGFVTFNLSSNIRFVNCTSISTKKEFPTFRLWNSTQTPNNLGTSIIGGRYECTDPTGPGTFDTRNGPTRNLTITGAEIVDCAVDLNMNNNHEVAFRNNTLRLTRRVPADFRWLSVGRLHVFGGSRAIAVVAGNLLKSEVVQPDDLVTIYGYLDDFNSNASMRVAGNTLSVNTDSGDRSRILLASASVNAGTPQIYSVEDNEMTGAIQRQKLGVSYPVVIANRNRTPAGDPIAVTDI